MKLVLLGDPVEQSLSPAIHNAALESLGLSGSYRAIVADADRVALSLKRMRDGVIQGANVTMPLKQVAASLADISDSDVEASGAANTLVTSGGSVYAHNTDVVAFRRLAHRLDADARFHILGSGGSAAAALVALRDFRLTASSRSSRSIDRLINRVGSEAEIVDWGRPTPGSWIVNATPLGTGQERLPNAVLRDAVGLIDLPYGERATATVAQARNQGLGIVDGIEFLVLQGSESFKIWTGHDAPLNVMTRAAQSAQGVARD